MKKHLRLSLAVLLLGSALTVVSWAQERRAEFRLPSHAREIAPDIFYLGTARDVDGKVVQGLAFLHPDPRRSRVTGRKGKPAGCFSVLANGARWKTTESYLVDPSLIHNANLTSQEILDETALALQAWNTSAMFLVFGNRVNGVVDGADEINPDGKNEVLFAPIASSGTIAVTITWGIFGGNPNNRQLVEWDTVFDDDGDWLWGNSGPTDETGCGAGCDPSIMDFRNIAQHEYGHAAGLGHPSNSCTEETMFAFAQEGETKKRTLNAGDNAGMASLYK